MRMLSDERDLVRMRDGMQRLWQIVHQPAFNTIADHFEAPVTGEIMAELPTGSRLDDFLSSVCGDTQHPVGTCRMDRQATRRPSWILTAGRSVMIAEHIAARIRA
jgi:5-(hydroxymethyl)furfural/furfural oxidase